ncbi:efflux RND transporter periplasmic adaptor subunit [Rhizobium lentis]|uniref:Multidrug resistance efflux pump n=1 Tax=Rhizobium lentis TaxID=1138194 RepID=A0A7W8XFH1_9HYPH|nr:HlyD family efflux transporter periplasmic adaptor subunit [Rhizobium lentis]MBB4574633.1 multidrug resistance efflux pump [Rhizobium lentis]MBB5550560.1 multidrug resistance efflux pump [Rhizobium lentis]MBB5561318.1 multidrug resistance efflux pump [Rhizobium lentis]MBB5567679.1 multidrug resistance efflux pump [Rhizobium lentis]
MSNIPNRELLRLTALIHLEKRARAAGDDELSFVMVNETLAVVRYRQALLWRSAPAGRVIAVSGVAIPDPYAPYLVWASGLCSQLEAQGLEGIHEVVSADVDPRIAVEWAEWLPPYLVWVPLGRPLGALVLARETPLNEGERNLLEVIADAYGHAWRAQLKGRGFRERITGSGKGRRRIAFVLMLAVLFASAFVPVRQSVLAQAEIAPREPFMIRAPLDGVVENILAKPNQTIAEGQTLITLDPRKLRNQLEVATRAKEAAEAELRQAKQFAVVDQKVRASLPVLQGKLDQQMAEVAYLTEQLGQTDIKAPRSGIAVYDDPNDWIGRPVAIGERMMLIADPSRVEVDARLPVADAIDLEVGGPVWLFLNIEPGRPLDAVLTSVSYKAQQGPDGVLAYRVKAQFAEHEQLPRIGLKGTAKLYGERVPLAYAIFRRPISAARQWLGF